MTTVFEESSTNVNQRGVRSKKSLRALRLLSVLCVKLFSLSRKVAKAYAKTAKK